MTRIAAVCSMLLVVLLAGTTACSDSSGPKEGTPPILPGLFVSAPVQVGAVQGSLEGAAALSVSAAAAYVSLAPGSVPDGRLAKIRNLATTQFVIAAVVDGGFDPVAIVASVGDTLAIEITRTGLVAPLAVVEVVRAPRPPVVVRTSPPPKQVDVPLNATVVIVFSTPIDATTLTTESVQLWRGATPVAGTVRFADAAHLRAEFHPDSLLASQTDYRLVVTQGIHDVNGQALESPLDVEFTTGVTVQVAARLAFLGRPGAADVGQPFWVQVAIEDALGNRVLSATDPVTLALDANPGAATLAGRLTVVATQGIATFYNLRIDRPGGGSGYTLAATAGTLASAVSGPFRVGDLVFTTVSAGFDNTCGVGTAGAAFCWGSRALGTGDSVQWGLSPVLVTGGLSFAAVDPGFIHTCGVTAAGTAYCWGENFSGTLGDGTTTDRRSPVPVAGGLSFAAVSAGGPTCGITTAGAAYCWGVNFYGALGDGTTTNRSSPVLVAGGVSFAAVSAGLYHTCGLTAAGAAYCWGLNSDGQLGDGTTTNRSTPVPVAGGLNFAAVDAGYNRTCGLTAAGAAYCWGHGIFGSLGDGTTNTNRSSPVLVAGGLSFAAVSAGNGYHACGVTAAGAAYCWGVNEFGALGNGTGAPEFQPGLVVGGLSFAAVSAGYYHTCGVTTAGAAYCWGAYEQGGNSDPDGDGYSTVPVKVTGQP